jgi:hypothetical protein
MEEKKHAGGRKRALSQRLGELTTNVTQLGI